MLGKDTNFRQINKHLIAVKDERAYNDLKEHFKDYFSFPKESDSILTFCYINSEEGLTFDFLCPYNLKENKYYEIENKNKKFIQVYRKGFFDECEMEIVSNDILKSNKLWDYIEFTIKHYENDENKIFTRKIKDIDHLREKDYPDDILVYIYKEGLTTERVWVRLTKVENGKLYGILQNEPNSNFGIHMFDEIKIEIFKDDDGQVNTIYMCK